MISSDTLEAVNEVELHVLREVVLRGLKLSRRQYFDLVVQYVEKLLAEAFPDAGEDEDVAAIVDEVRADVESRRDAATMVFHLPDEEPGP